MYIDYQVLFATSEDNLWRALREQNHILQVYKLKILETRPKVWKHKGNAG